MAILNVIMEKMKILTSARLNTLKIISYQKQQLSDVGVLCIQSWRHTPQLVMDLKNVLMQKMKNFALGTQF